MVGCSEGINLWSVAVRPNHKHRNPKIKLRERSTRKTNHLCSHHQPLRFHLFHFHSAPPPLLIHVTFPPSRSPTSMSSSLPPPICYRSCGGSRSLDHFLLWSFSKMTSSKILPQLIMYLSQSCYSVPTDRNKLWLSCITAHVMCTIWSFQILLFECIEKVLNVIVDRWGLLPKGLLAVQKEVDAVTPATTGLTLLRYNNTLDWTEGEPKI